MITLASRIGDIRASGFIRMVSRISPIVIVATGYLFLGIALLVLPGHIGRGPAFAFSLGVSVIVVVAGVAISLFQMFRHRRKLESALSLLLLLPIGWFILRSSSALA